MSIVKSIRIDAETQEMITFLRKHKVKTDAIIRKSAKEALEIAYIQLKKDLKKEYCPF